VYRSINTLLKNLISIWRRKNPPVIKSGDILKLKLGGDGRNVGRKQSHVMMTICLLNENEEVLKPENQHWYFNFIYLSIKKYNIIILLINYFLLLVFVYILVMKIMKVSPRLDKYLNANYGILRTMEFMIMMEFIGK
jgi:hypothetical protein